MNSYVNAVVEPRYDAALKEAKSIDNMIASSNRTPDELETEYPLLGLPITVKESIAVKGTCRSLILATIGTRRYPLSLFFSCSNLIYLPIGR